MENMDESAEILGVCCAVRSSAFCRQKSALYRLDILSAVYMVPTWVHLTEYKSCHKRCGVVCAG